ncbi:polyphosphate--glucose phosphotransferase [Lewinella sp. W8]|uniref:polyphosphate--glucose phosphotransferase n=1 Tax=Lewinella sp. W8 TaxID=2528208 RepID=UPI001067ADB4|nr:ROK family protein [Lewinella sp. W8]MTB53593.1 ROK family protein [Lewinella sp. W8]
MNDHIILGVDVGATGIKGGLVDVKTGELVTPRHRILTPHPATPKAVARTFKELVSKFDDYKGPVGVGFPAVVKKNVAQSAANIDKGWVGTSISRVFGNATGLEVHALNDADAAGMASMRFGTGRPYAKEGTVLMVTIGTGLGGALFVDGRLSHNLEIGQLFLKNQKVIVEKFISNRVRKEKNMDWPTFGKKFNKFLKQVDKVFNPDVIILGGGASKSFREFSEYLSINAEVKPAEMMNAAGTVGAALYAYEKHEQLESTF